MPGNRRSRARFKADRAGVGSAPMVGEVLADRSELEELVGTGGMWRVYRVLDRKGAPKILPQQDTGDDDYVEPFKREARSVAALSHPNIVTVSDRGEHA